ncbi:MAG TPA: DegT/DnrJ/EryC1/StrS aminotransferase family protein, partial [Candidatus Eremiobacteraceae bacterium]
MRAEFLPYCRPFIEQDDIEAVTDTLSRGWLTTGPKVREFEERFGAAAGVKHAVALNSCTAALHLGMIALGVGEGDEVVLPSLSFVAGANCVVQLGAKPVFCDIDPQTLCLSVETIERVATLRTKAIMTMHYAGRPASAAPIVAWAKTKGIKVFEDAALAIGMLDDGEWPGTRSDAAAYSFYATKNVTSAEGGMFLTNDDALMERVRALSLHGMDRDAWKRYTSAGSWRYDVTEHGYKDNLSDLAAALGISQLKKLDAMQRRRDAIARAYTDALTTIPGVTVGGIGKMQSNDRHG